MTDLLNGHELSRLEEEIRQTDQVLYVQKNNINGLNNSLKSITLKTGWAVYVWENTRGLVNIKSSEPPPPRTNQFKDAVKFALARKHFSVFVFPVLDKESWLQCKIFFNENKLESIHPVKFLFILPHDKNHSFFQDKAHKVTFDTGLDGNFVLRDGRWVSADELT
ncbi:hypothetical protein [Marinicella gelatinilytica]|uniref:hypothetical protein n=1 Tax=Marinicella gelatinilytica TaxID=2996017 RepID=UPI002260B925|nr:hypothetical protein [Marinicella gelatinilytica]MCX7544631.1 hypothetical protein [Marinicella gelatinilytica]